MAMVDPALEPRPGTMSTEEIATAVSAISDVMTLSRLVLEALTVFAFSFNATFDLGSAGIPENRGVADRAEDPGAGMPPGAPDPADILLHARTGRVLKRPTWQPSRRSAKTRQAWAQSHRPGSARTRPPPTTPSRCPFDALTRTRFRPTGVRYEVARTRKRATDQRGSTLHALTSRLSVTGSSRWASMAIASTIATRACVNAFVSTDDVCAPQQGAWVVATSGPAVPPAASGTPRSSVVRHHDRPAR